MLIEKITPTEHDLIAAYRAAYAGSTRVSEPWCSNEVLLKEWEGAKFGGGLSRLFGDKLILEKDVVLSKRSSEVQDAMYDKLFCPAHPFLIAFSKLADKIDWGEGLRRYDKDYFINLIDCYVVTTNVWHGRSFNIPTPSGKTIAVQAGTKVLKIFSKVAQAYGLEDFEDFRIKHSQVLNTAKFTGTLCLSIHPLDYMTMSDNDSDWSSCMSWKHDGCYRQGTVEMMNSPMVVVGYLKSKNDWEIDLGSESYVWNNKKFRSLYVINEDLITNVKGYPYKSDEISTELIKWLKELAEANWGITYDNKILEYRHNSTTTINGKEYRFEFETNQMYNDFGSCDHLVCINSGLKPGHIIHNYSGLNQCMCCGQVDVMGDYGEGSLVCNYCYGYRECDHCRCESHISQMREVDGERLCDWCYNTHTAVDIATGERHLKVNMIHFCFDRRSMWGIGRETIRECYMNQEEYEKLNLDELGDVLSNRHREVHILASSLTEKGQETFHISMS